MADAMIDAEIHAVQSIVSQLRTSLGIDRYVAHWCFDNTYMQADAAVRDRRTEADTGHADIHSGMGRYYRGGRRPGPCRPGGGMGWVRQARHGNGAVSPAQNSSSLTGVVESFTTPSREDEP